MAASDVKEMIQDALDDVRRTLVGLIKDFGEQTGYVKAKAGVIFGYVVIAILSLIFIPPAGEKNPLDARVKVSSIQFGSREKTYVEVTNDSSSEWPAALVSISGSYLKDGKTQVTGTYMLTDRWRRGEKKTLFPEKFKDARGLPADMEVQVTEVTIDVGGVKYIKPIKKGAPQ